MGEPISFHEASITRKMVAPRPKPRPPPPPYTRPSSSSCDSLAPRGPPNALTQRAKPKALPPREKPRAPQRKPPPPSCSPPPTPPPCSPPPNTPRRAPSRGRNLERTARTRHDNSADRRIIRVSYPDVLSRVAAEWRPPVIRYKTYHCSPMVEGGRPFILVTRCRSPGVNGV